MAIVGHLVGFHPKEVSYFSGPTIISFDCFGMTFRMGCIPIAANVQFGDDFDRGGCWRKIVVMLSGCVLLIVIAVICVPAANGFPEFLSAFPEIFRGTTDANGAGVAYAKLALAYIQSHNGLALLGITAAKLAAIILMPIPVLNGGQTLMALWSSAFSIPQTLAQRIMLVGLLL
ncbi:MAG: hypothetical protein R3C01_10800 [Planctomycetaceae bacterium]